jgi:hypothetical protein
MLEVLGGVQLAAAAGLTLIALFVSGAMDEIHGRELGYEEDNRYSFTLDASALVDDDARAEAYRRFLAALDDDATVRGAAVVGAVPGFLGPYTPVRGSGDEPVMAAGMGVGVGYLGSAGTALVRGRDFRTADIGADVALITETLAEALWARENPIGRTLTLPGNEAPLRVIGVVEAGTYANLDPLPLVLWPVPPPTGSRAMVVTHARGDLGELRQALQQAMAAADPDLSLYSLAPVAEWFERHWLLTRSVGAVLRTLALLGLAISAIGIYAGFSTIVASRRRELGIRMSLGASPTGVVRWVLLRAGRVVIVGYVAGAIVAVAGSRLVQAYLFDADLWQPSPYLVGLTAAATLAAIATAAPAVRAATIDPARSLRSE